MSSRSRIVRELPAPAGRASVEVTTGMRSAGAQGRAAEILLSTKALWALAAAGCLIRIIVYAANRSLWFDEAALALNLMERSTRELLSPLDFGQAAPFGFLIVEHALGSILGYSDYALRLFPLLAGLAALMLFVPLARRLLTPLGAVVAVALFAVAQGPVYYSSELKPYAVDVAATVCLLLIGAMLVEDDMRPRRRLVLATAGVTTILFSFAAVFVLASIAVAFLVTVIRRGGATPANVGVLLVWAIGITATAVAAVSRLDEIRHGFEASTDAVIGSHSVISVNGVKALGSNLAAALGMSQQPPWTELEKVAAALAVVGATSLVLRAPLRGVMVLLPLAFTVGVAAFGQYPLTYRTTLFLVPILCLVLGEGVGRLATWVPPRWAPVAALGAAALVAGGPLIWSAKALVKSPTHEEMRPLLAYVSDHWQRGDTLYVAPQAQVAFLYYVECACLPDHGRAKTIWPVTPETNDPSAVRSKSPAVVIAPVGEQPHQLRALDGVKRRERVWFIYAHADSGQLVFVKRRLLPRLDELGTRMASLSEPGAHAYLYRIKRHSTRSR
jgi:hypothetical protein